MGAQPAVAFYEDGVAQAITATLKEMGLGFRRDGYGNIIVHLPGLRSEVPALALVAHMDHPGFEAIAAQGELLIGQALGGVPATSFSEGVPLQLVLSDGGRVSAITAGRHGEEGDRQVLVRVSDPQPLDLPRPVAFDLPDFQPYSLQIDAVTLPLADIGISRAVHANGPGA